ncbi:MAG: GTP cyclohydrolase I FolE [Bacteroidota bacterium]
MSASPLKVSSLHDTLAEDIIHHFNGRAKTPLHKDAFELSQEEKIEIISAHFREILHTLGMDLSDESIKDTPLRVAKMYVQETFKGLLPENEPAVTQFDNDYRYSQMLVEKSITVFSTCEHHLVPIHGKAHVAYFSSGKVIGLSKLNRLVDFYARRPQVQERLTIQIAEALKKALQTNDVAVVIDAHHMCVASRGIRDVNSSTVTAEYSGKFLNPEIRKEFLEFIRS